MTIVFRFSVLIITILSILSCKTKLGAKLKSNSECDNWIFLFDEDITLPHLKIPFPRLSNYSFLSFYDSVNSISFDTTRFDFRTNFGIANQTINLSIPKETGVSICGIREQTQILINQNMEFLIDGSWGNIDSIYYCLINAVISTEFKRLSLMFSIYWDENYGLDSVIQNRLFSNIKKVAREFYNAESFKMFNKYICELSVDQAEKLKKRYPFKVEIELRYRNRTELPPPF